LVSGSARRGGGGLWGGRAPSWRGGWRRCRRRRRRWRCCRGACGWRPRRLWVRVCWQGASAAAAAERRPCAARHGVRGTPRGAWLTRRGARRRAASPPSARGVRAGVPAFEVGPTRPRLAARTHPAPVVCVGARRDATVRRRVHGDEQAVCCGARGRRGRVCPSCTVEALGRSTVGRRRRARVLCHVKPHTHGGIPFFICGAPPMPDVAVAGGLPRGVGEVVGQPLCATLVCTPKFVKVNQQHSWSSSRSLSRTTRDRFCCFVGPHRREHTPRIYCSLPDSGRSGQGQPTVRTTSDWSRGRIRPDGWLSDVLAPI